MAPATPKPLKRKHLDDSEASGSGRRKKTKEECRAEKRAKREAEVDSPVKRRVRANSASSEVLAEGGPTPTSGNEFKIVRARTSVSLPPRFAGDPQRGVEEILDNLVMRYVPSLQGVLLSRTNVTFTQQVALMYAEGPFPTTTLEFDAGVWAPEVGMHITGRISLHAADHISLLVHRTFNASIDRMHIPDTGEWEYVHGPAANDPELGAEDLQGDEIHGRWVHAQTGEPLGGESGLVEFTVVGYTVANQMMTLHGSLQPDPFAPQYYTTRHNVSAPNVDEASTEPEMNDHSMAVDSEDEVEVMEEETAVPRGKRRKVADVVQPAQESEIAPVRKQKKGTVNGEASVAVVEAAVTVAEGEEKKKRKKNKKQVEDL